MPNAPYTPPLTLGRRFTASIVTGLSIAIASHLVTVFVFFVTNGSAATNISPISNFFLPSSVVVFLLSAIAASIGALRTWYWALAAGVIAGLVGAFAGTVYGNLASGTPWSADVALAVIATLVGTNLPFVLAVIAVTVTVGRRVWALFARRSGSTAPIALIRQPATLLAEGEVTFIDRVAIDPDLADQQWDAYVTALEANGFETFEVASANDLPDSVFIEDAVLVFGGTAIITSPGAESRRAEIDGARDAVTELGLTLREITLPGTLDGGDVLEVGTTVYVGSSGRTNAEGIRQLRAILAPLGYSVVGVPVTKVLHLKSAVTALPEGTVVGYAKHVDNPGAFDRFLALPEAGGAVVVLNSTTVLMAASVPKSIALIESLGYTVVTVDISEFEKLEGCVTCLSVRIR
jgi:dimethylargininase